MKSITLKQITMSYHDEGTGIPVLFVHGFPLSSLMWEKQLSALATSFRVLAPDLRGFGKSPATAGTVTMGQFADDLRELIDSLKVGPVVLVGHSMGGYIALNFIQRFPQLVRGLVLVGTKSGADTPEAASKRRETAQKIKTKGAKFLIKDMSSKMLAKSQTDPAIIEKAKELMVPDQPEGIIAALLGMAERPDSTASLVKVSTPVMVMTGAEDVLIPAEESKKMTSKFAQSALKVIGGAGHLMPYEKPEEFNEAMKIWLKRFS